mmetsp:Transcript_64919/g.128334  ORF Transcript_64919/g.128334 Transcript_64919/m.128334 type:complete len:226 (-) Transcript_64919:153-830(-)
MRPESKEARATPGRIDPDVVFLARDDPISRLTGITVVPITARATSAAPSGIEGSRPARRLGGRPMPNKVTAKHTIISITTAESSSDMRSVPPPNISRARVRAPSPRLISCRAANAAVESSSAFSIRPRSPLVQLTALKLRAGGGSSKMSTAAMAPAKLLHSYKKLPTTTNTAKQTRRTTARPVSVRRRTASPNVHPAARVSRAEPSCMIQATQAAMMTHQKSAVR